jgi:glutamate formiminotransferase/glutamate formiminotransferase/formiminotetrahydrofolate cyclodeaminase
MAVPNVSEGRDQNTIAAIGAAFVGADTDGSREAGRGGGADGGGDAGEGAVRLLDVHSDPDHHRSVFTLAGPPVALADALVRGARAAVELIDVVPRAGVAGGDAGEAGQHPHVGAVDVVPIVYLDPLERGAACAQSLIVGDRIGHELHVPVFLYGELSGADPQSQRTRAQLRRGGAPCLAVRIAGGEHHVAPDFGPARMHPSAGATLLAARPPLVAFNLQLAPPASVSEAHAVARLIREGGPDGLPGVRAIGVALAGGIAQLSLNIERPLEVPLATVVDTVSRHADIASAELVGLAPSAAFAGFPPEIPIPGFDPARHLIENALRC